AQSPAGGRGQCSCHAGEPSSAPARWGYGPRAATGRSAADDMIDVRRARFAPARDGALAPHAAVATETARRPSTAHGALAPHAAVATETARDPSLRGRSSA